MPEHNTESLCFYSSSGELVIYKLNIRVLPSKKVNSHCCFWHSRFYLDPAWVSVCPSVALFFNIASFFFNQGVIFTWQAPLDLPILNWRPRRPSCLPSCPLSLLFPFCLSWNIPNGRSGRARKPWRMIGREEKKCAGRILCSCSARGTVTAPSLVKTRLKQNQ